MKNVLIISSSPRKGGNSDLLCERFAEGARDAGHAVTLIRLAEKPVAPCLGCYACSGGKPCVRKDDAPAIVDAMLRADVIVLGTPVYFYTMNAQLKALIDRTVMVFPRIVNKRFWYLMTMADEDEAKFAGTLAALRGFVECCEGSVEEGYLGAPGVYEKGAVRDTPFYGRAYELGKALA